MAYIGVAVLEGTKMWEERRRTEEADRRLQAEKELWNQTNEAATALATARNAEVQKAASMQKVLAENSGKIVAGGEAGAKGIAAFYNAQLGNTNDYEYQGTADGKIQLVDKKTNKVVQETAAPSGQDAVIALRGLAQDLTAQYNTAASIAAESRKQQHELNKLDREYGYKYRQAIDEKKFDLAGTKYKADVDAATKVNVANIGANKDVIVAQYNNLEDWSKVNIANSLTKATGQPIYFHDGNFMSAVTGQPFYTNNPDLVQKIGDSTADLISSHGLNAYAPYPYVVQNAYTIDQQRANINTELPGIPSFGNLFSMSTVPTSTFINTGVPGFIPPALVVNQQNLAAKNVPTASTTNGQASGLSTLFTQGILGN